MAIFVLKDAMWEEGLLTYHDGTEVRVKYLYKQRMHATRCDACAKVFRGRFSDATWIGGGNDSTVCLTMTKDHERYCNILRYDICSVKCGMDLVEGLWKEAYHYCMDPEEDEEKSEADAHPFVTLRAKVQSYTMSACSKITSKRKLLKMWNDSASLPMLSKGMEYKYRPGAGGLVTLHGGDAG